MVTPSLDARGHTPQARTPPTPITQVTSDVPIAHIQRHYMYSNSIRYYRLRPLIAFIANQCKTWLSSATPWTFGDNIQACRSTITRITVESRRIRFWGLNTRVIVYLDLAFSSFNINYWSALCSCIRSTSVPPGMYLISLEILRHKMSLIAILDSRLGWAENPWILLCMVYNLCPWKAALAMYCIWH